MSISIRCGTDIVDISRIRAAVSRRGRHFLDRIWTPEEQQDCRISLQLSDTAVASLAARFAAKEAAAKALGTGIGRAGIRWTDFRVERLQSGEPVMTLEGAAQEVFRQMGGRSIAISLSHERQTALAFCILTCEVAESGL